MHFFVPNLNSKILNEEQAAHLFVMRVQEGKVYSACDLNGHVGQIRINVVNKKSKTIEFDQEGIPKLQRFEQRIMFQAVPEKVYLDKLIEILPMAGITNLYLFYSDFSIEYPLNQDRLSKILIRSCEQTETAYLPKIVLLNKSDLEIEIQEHKPVVLDCGVNPDISKSSAEHRPALVGPEGGWSKEEIQYFQKLQLPFESLGAIVYPAWIAGLIYEKSKK